MPDGSSPASLEHRVIDIVARELLLHRSEVVPAAHLRDDLGAD